MSVAIATRDSGWRNITRKQLDGCVLNLTGERSDQALIKDMSGQGNDGTITGATWTKLSSGLTCLSFDGVDDVITVTINSSLKPTTYITIMQWIYMAAKPAVGTFPRFIGTLVDDGGYKGYGFLQFPDSYIIQGELSTANNGLQQMSIVAGAQNTWYFICLTYDGANIAVYSNGAFVSNTPATGAITYSASQPNLLIGKSSPDVGSVVLSGKLGLAIISGVAFSTTQISQIYQNEYHLFPH